MQMFFIRSLIFTVLIVSVNQALAAACCGGSSILPSLLTGDDKIQAQITYSTQNNLAYVDGNGNWWHMGKADTSTVLKFDFATLISDRFQIGATLPVTERFIGPDSTPFAFGDAAVDIAYEAIPEWSYSSFMPKGIMYLQVTAPTGRSIYETTNPTAIDVTGRGFWAVAAGAILLKTWNNPWIGGVWDSNLNFDFHLSQARHFANSWGDGTYVPGNGYDISFGGGWNKGDLRLGANLGILFEDAVNGIANPNTGEIDLTGTAQKSWTGSLIVSYMMSRHLSLGISYADQTLFGQPQNTYLTKTISINLQSRWER